jgi:hypothetical protein
VSIQGHIHIYMSYSMSNISDEGLGLPHAGCKQYGLMEKEASFLKSVTYLLKDEGNICLGKIKSQRE